MIYNLEKINAKSYSGDLLFLYGDEVAERTLPLGKKEIDLVRARRAEKKDFLLVFDRLPYHLYFLSFDSEKPAPECQEMLRRSATDLLKCLEADKVETLAVSAEGTLPEEVAAFVEGLTLADYSFDRYRSKDKYHLATLAIDSLFLKPEELEASQRLWNRIFWCREWVNFPVQDFNAAAFADELASIAVDLKDVHCTVMDKRQIEALRMGGLMAVNRGSVDEPRFVVLEYKPREAAKQQPICLVGKGIMYDTGGLNIKPEDYMQEMKSDMAGAATMASVLFAAADNRLPVHLVALLPMTDNRPGFNAYAADDILTMYDGTTVEVVNTDAEGRLILADAIAYAARNYSPRLIVDAATLTGAAVRAISTFGIAAMQVGADNPMTMLKLVGSQVYERLVEFPMWSDYDDMIKSPIADLRNCGTTPQAGTITAGKFLAHFAANVPYIHLDIAGVAYFTKPQHYYRVGASGYGIRLLYAFLQMQDMIKEK
ncbi:MAG: leucyl aminopeptidase family protein [Bacteroidales bacterium]|nr:leucyl aminopeptidase family protein [Bacteroidales bacterium]